MFYTTTEAQKQAETKLNQQGFWFLHWIPATPDGNGQPVEGTEHLGCMVMRRKLSRFSTEYREIEPCGHIG